ncbi:MAG TPA: hypothetical protein VFL42_07505, partial [Terriglobales bacterium]|nr:hypothetical protein [Terriglobales bacterium]
PYGAYFGPYVRDPAFFHCPADHSKDPVRHLPRVRSYSMNNFLNGRDFDGYGRSQLSTKIEELSHPGQTYTILDEREDSINDGTFFVSLYPYQLVDYPAATHNAAGGFAFGDGHAETHRWLDPRTMPILRPGQVLGLNINIAGDSDVLWLQTHASSR